MRKDVPAYRNVGVPAALSYRPCPYEVRKPCYHRQDNKIRPEIDERVDEIDRQALRRDDGRCEKYRRRPDIRYQTRRENYSLDPTTALCPYQKNRHDDSRGNRCCHNAVGNASDEADKEAVQRDPRDKRDRPLPSSGKPVEKDEINDRRIPGEHRGSADEAGGGADHVSPDPESGIAPDGVFVNVIHDRGDYLKRGTGDQSYDGGSFSEPLFGKILHYCCSPRPRRLPE